MRDRSDGITFSVLIFLHGRIPGSIDVLNVDASLAPDTAISAVGGCDVETIPIHRRLSPLVSTEHHKVYVNVRRVSLPAAPSLIISDEP